MPYADFTVVNHLFTFSQGHLALAIDTIEDLAANLFPDENLPVDPLSASRNLAFVHVMLLSFCPYPWAPGICFV